MNLPPELMMLLQQMGGEGAPGGGPGMPGQAMPGSPAPTGAPMPPGMDQGGSGGPPSGISQGAIERKLAGGGGAPDPAMQSINGGMPMGDPMAGGGAPPAGGPAGMPTDPNEIIQLLLQMGAVPNGAPQ